MGISQATFYRWKRLYGGLMPSEVKKLRQLEEENTRLRRVVADFTLDGDPPQAMTACSGTRDDRLCACFVPGVDPPSLPNCFGMPRDLALPFPLTRAGAREKVDPRDRRDTDAVWLPPDHGLLRREGWHVNVKRVHRPYRLERLEMRLKPPRRRVLAKLCSEQRDVVSYSMEAVCGSSRSWTPEAGR